MAANLPTLSSPTAPLHPTSFHTHNHKPHPQLQQHTRTNSLILFTPRTTPTTTTQPYQLSRLSSPTLTTHTTDHTHNYYNTPYQPSRLSYPPSIHTHTNSP
ncbi:hypothetical protein Pcinc_037027 [Petrolisthes cinctipes]|uniref:Uncharacterized protein n=1 Tax=Petrolisthes cinctipes TaxID=88211 RepID=A0AAE1ELY2_PETCI|nr:hypothetical protein Pcinc_037027 [Petrolisthes cinctipes]